MAKTFNELEVYRLGVEIDEGVWPLRKAIQPSSPGLWDQLDRSSGSICDNVAEGFGRETRADFRNFLRYSRASAHEAESQVRRAKRRGLIDAASAEVIVAKLQNVSVKIKNFQNYLKRAAKSSNSYEAREPQAPYLASWELKLEKQIPDWWEAVCYDVKHDDRPLP